jgi:hypothetical protein
MTRTPRHSCKPKLTHLDVAPTIRAARYAGACEGEVRKLFFKRRLIGRRRASEQRALRANTYDDSKRLSSPNG